MPRRRTGRTGPLLGLTMRRLAMRSLAAVPRVPGRAVRVRVRRRGSLQTLRAVACGQQGIHPYRPDSYLCPGVYSANQPPTLSGSIFRSSSRR